MNIEENNSEYSGIKVRNIFLLSLLALIFCFSADSYRQQARSVKATLKASPGISSGVLAADFVFQPFLPCSPYEFRFEPVNLHPYFYGLKSFISANIPGIHTGRGPPV